MAFKIRCKNPRAPWTTFHSRSMLCCSKVITPLCFSLCTTSHTACFVFSHRNHPLFFVLAYKISRKCSLCITHRKELDIELFLIKETKRKVLSMFLLKQIHNCGLESDTVCNHIGSTHWNQNFTFSQCISHWIVALLLLCLSLPSPPLLIPTFSSPLLSTFVLSGLFMFLSVPFIVYISCSKISALILDEGNAEGILFFSNIAKWANKS